MDGKFTKDHSPKNAIQYHKLNENTNNYPVRLCKIAMSFM